MHTFRGSTWVNSRIKKVDVTFSVLILQEKFLMREFYGCSYQRGRNNIGGIGFGNKQCWSLFWNILNPSPLSSSTRLSHNTTVQGVEFLWKWIISVVNKPGINPPSVCNFLQQKYFIDVQMMRPILEIIKTPL